jgi:hypothetical protein
MMAIVLNILSGGDLGAPLGAVNNRPPRNVRQLNKNTLE